jgi:hypothetical protein
MRGPNFDKLIWALLALSPFQRSIAVLLLPVFFMVCCFAVVTDVGDSGDGSSCNEPMSVPVSSSKSHLLLEENLATAPVPTINPRSIPAIPEVYRLFIMWRKQCECSWSFYLIIVVIFLFLLFLDEMGYHIVVFFELFFWFFA